ncbi:RNA polymerase subunit sigma [Pasteurellaceae bacterium RH1A]|nr:RNA polymerase subunit sigma [Pasteurellaceae bacterium RH1A]
MDMPFSQGQLEEIRGKMLKFALLQVQDQSLAEDMVQEAFLNGLKNQASFKGQAAFSTWIFAILKNKILDYFRQKKRWVLESELADQDEDTNHFFDENGHWKSQQSPFNLAKHDGEIYSKEFWRLFEACLTHLPARQARVFMMREYLELDSEQICSNLEISTANLHTSLYRARLQLQACLTRKLGD